MKLLAIETASEACSAALYLDGALSERYALAPREHARLILPMVDELLREADLSPGVLDAVAFGRGPGAFTGLRIAAGVAQGIAFGVDLPVVAVSSLAALAQGLYRERGAARVLAAIDARIGEVYWGKYEADATGLMILRGEERVVPPGEVSLPEGGDWHGVGSAWGIYGDSLRTRLSGRLATIDAARYPRACDVAVLAAAAYRRGEAVSAELAAPVYLRDEVAVKQR
ncbi:MAG: tRNA (adenosine(37)-N6)-threonylcarbamoyltransferase complex dimerization subunit type 1 TsaB [Pseudomonadota bacterium]